MTLKTSFKKAFACFCACVLMLYSLITAPVFRVGAINQGDDIATIGSSFISFIIGLATSGEAPVLSPVVGAALGLSFPLVTAAAQKSVSPGFASPLQLPKSIPSNSFAGTYFNADDPDTRRQLTFYQYSWDYTGLDTSFGVCADTILCCEDYTVGISVTPDNDWVSSSSRENMSIQLACSSFFGSGVWSISPSVSLSDSSGVYPSAHVIFYVRFSDGQGFFSDRSISGTSVSTPLTFEAWPASYPKYQYTYDRSTFESVFRNASGRFLLAYVYSPSTDRIQSTSYPVLSSPITTSEQAINYYDNSVRPFVINNYSSTYPDYTRQYITYQEYYDALPADPSATTPAQTGIVIIEPFTLPPEWVQSDVVELQTDHYTVPYEDMIDQPFDYLAGLGTSPNPSTPVLNARKRAEISTATRAVSVEEGSPPLVWDLADYETKTALTDYFIFAENLLHDTGLYNLVGSLIAVGIIVSLV